MVTTDLPLRDLRAQRQRLSEQVAHLSWLRRLVSARSDLEVARLTSMPSTDDELEPLVRAALALEGPSDPELLHALSSTSRELDERSARLRCQLDALTEELVARLVRDPSSCLAP